MAIPVRNISKRSDKRCRCDNWYEHWKMNSRVGNSFLCANANCFEVPETGSCVVRMDDDIKNEWIIPMCKGCADLESDYTVDNSTEFVSLDSIENCKETKTKKRIIRKRI